MSKSLVMMGKSLIVGIGFLAMASAAQAEPITLTEKQMDGVTAGSHWGGGINLNIAITTQVAVPTAISIVVCPLCSSANINSSAFALGSNDSITFQLASQ